MKMIILLVCVSLGLFGQAISASSEKISVDTTRSVDVDIRRSYDVFSVIKISAGGKSGYLVHNIFLNKIYYGKIISQTGKILGYFPADEMNTMICVDGPPTIKRGCRDLPEGEILLRIPLIPGGKMAEIFSPQGEEILTIDLSQR